MMRIMLYFITIRWIRDIFIRGKVLTDMKFKKFLSIAIYVVGVLCVIIFMAKGIIGGSNVPNPEAMLPLTEYEIAWQRLGIGFIPMFLSSIFMIHTWKICRKLYRGIVLIPAVITFVPFVCGVVLLAVMLILGVRDAIEFQMS